MSTVLFLGATYCTETSQLFETLVAAIEFVVHILVINTEFEMCAKSFLIHRWDIKNFDR